MSSLLQAEPIYDNMDMHYESGSSYASAPDCSFSLNDYVRVAVEIWGAWTSLKTGIKLINKGAQSSGYAQGLALAGGISLMGTGAGLIADIFLNKPQNQCMISFVMDPVLYDKGGRMLDKHGNVTDKYYDARRSTHSEHIKVCTRNNSVLDTVWKSLSSSITSFFPATPNYSEFGFSTESFLEASDKAYCFKKDGNRKFDPLREASQSGFALGKGQWPTITVKDPLDSKANAPLDATNSLYLPSPLYEGEGSLFCREELRNAGYGFRDYFAKTEGSAKDKRYRIAVESKGNVNLTRFLSLASQMELTCQTAHPTIASPVKELSINSYYAFEAYLESENKVCARIKSIGPISRSYVIGCHLRKLEKKGKLCSASFEETERIPDGNGGYRVIKKWNNEPCTPCLKPFCHNARKYVQSYFPLTSFVVGCVDETVDMLLNKGCGSRPALTDYVNLVQFKQIVRLFLAMAIWMFGFTIAFAKEAPKKGEIFGFLVKIALVLFLSQQDGKGIRTVYDVIKSFAWQSSRIFLQASNNGLCNFEPSDYKNSINSNPSFVKNIIIWDSLDCRILYYLGSPIPRVAPGGFVHMPRFKLTLIENLGNVFVSVQFFLMAIIIVIFALCFLALVVYITKIAVFSFLGLAVLCTIGPIFSLFTLFDYTKQWFDTWLKEIVAYAIFPILMFAYVGFFGMIYDNLFFGRTQFTKVNSRYSTKQTAYFAVLNPIPGTDEYCDPKGVACWMQAITTKRISGTDNIVASVFSLHQWSVFFSALFRLIIATMFLFLSASVILGIAMELSGGSRSLRTVAGLAGSAGMSASSYVGKFMTTIGRAVSSVSGGK